MTAQAATQVIEAGEGAIAPGAAAVERAPQTLAAGGLVAFPTETVYGPGADATNRAAVARRYDAQGRPSLHPLIAHVRRADAARADADGAGVDHRCLPRSAGAAAARRLGARGHRAGGCACRGAAVCRVTGECRRGADRPRRACLPLCPAGAAAA